MDELKSFLQSLPNEAARKAFAERCNTSIGHLRNLLYVKTKTCSPELAAAIELESGGVVTRRAMRPKDWQQIWPEIAKPAPRSERATASESPRPASRHEIDRAFYGTTAPPAIAGDKPSNPREGH